MARILIETARCDLLAANCLHSTRLYAQSIFYLQQSVEKALKSLAVHLGLIKEADLLKVSHNSIKLLSMVIESARGATKSISKMNEILGFEHHIIKSNEEFNQKSSKSLEILNDNKKLEEMGIRTLCATEYYCAILIDKLNKVISVDTTAAHSEMIQSSSFHETKESIGIMVKELADVARNAGEPVDIVAMQVEVSEKLDVVIKILYQILPPFYVLSNISYLVDPHAVTSRYPVKSAGILDPNEFYTDKLPLISHFSEISKLVSLAINRIVKLESEPTKLK